MESGIDTGSQDQRSRALPVPYGIAVLVAPRSVFRRIEDTPAYGWALFGLVGLLMAIGYATIQTGLIDRDVDAKVERKLEQLEASQGLLIDRIQFREQMAAIQKEGEFEKVLGRLAAVVLSPLGMLALLMLIASAFYSVVALTGRKPEYHTLMSICVYAAYIELFAAMLRLAMMIHYRSTSVGTTFAGLMGGAKGGVLAAIDPFKLWFWALVAIGLIVTHQLGRKMAIALCTFFALAATGVRMAMLTAGA